MGSKFAASIIFKFYFADFFSGRRASPNDAGSFGASISSARYKREEKSMRRAAAFCLFMGTSPINFGLLGANGNTLKSKTTAKLREKRTSIAAVRDIL
jgi:hypothetical protein